MESNDSEDEIPKNFYLPFLNCINFVLLNCIYV
jgi:hypothetical protein